MISNSVLKSQNNAEMQLRKREYKYSTHFCTFQLRNQPTESERPNKSLLCSDISRIQDEPLIT